MSDKLDVRAISTVKSKPQLRYLLPLFGRQAQNNTTTFLRTLNYKTLNDVVM